MQEVWILNSIKSADEVSEVEERNTGSRPRSLLLDWKVMCAEEVVTSMSFTVQSLRKRSCVIITILKQSLRASASRNGHKLICSQCLHFADDDLAWDNSIQQ